MISLSSKPKLLPTEVLILPSYCVPNKDSDHLAEKREAQLKWMREKGMTYLGDPTKLVARPSSAKRSVAPVRLVSVRKEGPDAAREA